MGPMHPRGYVWDTRCPEMSAGQVDGRKYIYIQIYVHQKSRWVDEIKKFVGITWQQKAQDRVDWRNMGGAFALQWAYSG